jgi:hypothetical protein
MNDNLIQNRRQFLCPTNPAATAHNVSKFKIVPADHNPKADLPKGCARGQTPAQPNYMVDWPNCVRSLCSQMKVINR